MNLFEFTFSANPPDDRLGYIFVVAQTRVVAISMSNTWLKENGYSYKISVDDMVCADLEVSELEAPRVYEIINP